MTVSNKEITAHQSTPKSPTLNSWGAKVLNPHFPFFRFLLNLKLILLEPRKQHLLIFPKPGEQKSLLIPFNLLPVNPSRMGSTGENFPNLYISLLIYQAILAIIKLIQSHIPYETGKCYSFCCDHRHRRHWKKMPQDVRDTTTIQPRSLADHNLPALERVMEMRKPNGGLTSLGSERIKIS